MRSAKRSPSASSTVAVADVAGRPAVSRGNSFVEVVITSPCWFRGAAKPSRPSTALEDAREGQSGGVGGLGRAGARLPTLRPPGVAAQAPPPRLGAHRWASSATPCRSAAARDSRPRRGRWRPTPPRLGRLGTRPARSSALPAWTSAMSIDRCHAAGTSARKAPVGLSAFDEREQPAEHRAVAVAELARASACWC